MPLKVMFLDDEADICEIYKDFFSTSHIEVYVFVEPKKAIEFARNNLLDMIFLDYRMPGTNGESVAIEIGGDVPKYLITGEINVETDYSFEKIIPKPVDLDEIQTLINHQLAAKKNS